MLEEVFFTHKRSPSPRLGAMSCVLIRFEITFFFSFILRAYNELLLAARCPIVALNNALFKECSVC